MADPKPQKYYLRDAAGNPTQTNDPKLASELADLGDKPISAEEAQASANQQRDMSYVDQNWGLAGKAAMGAFSGLTLGLGPGIAAATGMVDRGHLRAAQESPIFTAGDIAGMALPAFLTGGESVGARGALSGALRMSPAGLMELGGSATERMVGRFLGSEAGVMGRLASAPAKMAARGAFEGAAINLGSTVGNALIDNKPLAAESTLANTVDGALLGAFLGGGIGTVGSLAGQAVDSVASLGKKAIGKSGVGEAMSFKRLGYSAEEVAAIGGKAERKANLIKTNEIFQDSGTGVNLGSSSEKIKEAVGISAGKYKNEIGELAAKLDTEAPHMVPTLQIASSKLDVVKTKWTGTIHEKTAIDMVTSANKELGYVAKKPTFENWMKARDHIEAKLKSFEIAPSDNVLIHKQGIGEKIQREILDQVDGTIADALKGAAKSVPGMEGIADKYAGIHAKLRMAEILEETIGKKAAADVLRVEPAVTPRDFGTFIGMTAIGHPISGAAWLAAKGVGRQLQNRLEPAMAQMAFNHAIGSKASLATNQVTGRISTSVRNFFKAGSKTPTRAVLGAAKAVDKKDRIDRKKYEETASRIEQLTSAAHADKVQRYAESLDNQGYGEFANHILDSYNRASSYLTWVSPARQGTKALTSLRPHLASKMPTLAEFKYMRQVDAITDPMGTLLGGLEKGNLSRDAVKAIKYVYPELHAKFVEEATMQIAEMKAAGEYLPMSKISSLGIALDAAIDSTLTPEYVNEVQMALNSNPPGPAPSAPQGQPMNNQDWMTPLQKLGV